MLLGLDEIDVDLLAEGGAECGRERGEALDGLVMQEQVDRSEHRVWIGVE